MRMICAQRLPKPKPSPEDSTFYFSGRLGEAKSRKVCCANFSSTTVNPATIFIQIASYRDPECSWTVQDAFAKARCPERLFVGICKQDDPQTDGNGLKPPLPGHLREKHFHWQESQGVCWARHQAQQLWDGQDYVLSIDSHTRFAPKWDELLIRQLDQCPSPKAILSNHPAAYKPPDRLETTATPTVLQVKPYSLQGDLRVCGANLKRAPQVPLRGAFCCAGFIFAKSDFIREVPYDPFFYFDQEEISLAARLFTHGFDVYSLKNVLLFHYYRHATDPDTCQPHLHWEDNSGWLRLRERGRKRLNHLLGHTLSENPDVVCELEKYGLGTARTLGEYESFCGIDFKRRRLSERALRCGFIDRLDRYLDKPIHVPELDDAPKMPEAPKGTVAMPPPQTALWFDHQQALDRITKANKGRKLDVECETPEGVLLIYKYINDKTCRTLMKYADSQAFSDLGVVDPEKSKKDRIVQLKSEGRITHHVHIDGKALEILNLFNDIFCRQMASFYNVDFEWYERPQILRYPPGGKYNQHADAEHQENGEWVRAQDRDYSVLLYLNDQYEGGEIQLVNWDFTIKPKPGMMLAFPSDWRYLHAALPTTSGIRYAMVSWGAVVGSRRVHSQMPFASIYVRQKNAKS